MNRYRNLILVFALCQLVTYAFAQDSLNIRRLGQISLPNGANAVEVVGSYAYIAGGTGRLHVIDVSNPETPMEVGFYDTPNSARDITISGNYAYVADYYSGLRIIDISNPITPVEAGFFSTSGIVFGVAVSGSYAYVADDYGGLRVINIANPANPTEVGSCLAWHYVYSVKVAGNFAYVTYSVDFETGLQVIDISNPAVPTLAGVRYTQGNAQGVDVFRDYAYLTIGTFGLRVINISNPATPTETGYLELPGYAVDVTVSGAFAYVADGTSGLRVVNITNPAAPIEAGFYDTPGFVHGVAFSGNLAYVADDNYFGIYDCSEATVLSVISLSPAVLDFGNVPIGQDSDLMLTIQNTGTAPLTVNSITVPTGFRQLFSLPLTIAVNSSFSDTIRFHPTEVQPYSDSIGISCNVPRNPIYLQVSGLGFQPGINVSPTSLAFGSVLTGQDSILLLSIQNTGTAPLIVNEITLPIAFRQSLDLPQTIVAGSYIIDSVRFHPIIAALHGGMMMIMSNAPTSPTYIPITGSGISPSSSDNIESEIPKDFFLAQNCPNPFNPTTSISFDLPKPGLTTLNVYNLLGQSVAELVNKQMEAGHHQVEFDGSALASGMYFCTLQAGSFKSSRKLMLMK
jgi:hypothetical protein